MTAHLLPPAPGVVVRAAQAARLGFGAALHGPSRVKRPPGVTVGVVPVPPVQVLPNATPPEPASQSLKIGGAPCWTQTLAACVPAATLDTSERPLLWLHETGVNPSPGCAISRM